MHWRNSASLILAAKSYPNIKENAFPKIHNYKLLLLKRQKNSSFLPGNYVFPGGTEDISDADAKWKDLYRKYNFNSNDFLSLVPTLQKPRPLIFQNDFHNCNQLSKEISLRITAIRETFEECGILLCKSSKDKSLPPWADGFSLNQQKLKEWQSKVHNNANNFFNMCESLACYPDLWSLHEWSNWLTPTALKGNRFNTIFFMCCMNVVPRTDHEFHEIEDLSWDCPTNLLESSSKYKLAPPQIYEITQISNFHSINNLLDYSIESNKKGVDLKLPVLVKLSDGTVYLLPGDSAYPADASFIKIQHLDHSNLTIEQYRDVPGDKKRLEFSKDKSKPYRIVKNYQS